MATTAEQLLAEAHYKIRSTGLKGFEKTMTPDGFYFLQLPAEIRNSIYELLLIDNATSNFGEIDPDEDLPTWVGFHKLDLSVTILRTCKEIYKEASSILYGGNTFIVYYNTDSETATSLINAQNWDPVFQTALTLKKVVHWKFSIDMAHRPHSIYSEIGLNAGVISFCQAIIGGSVKTIEISLGSSDFRRRRSDYEKGDMKRRYFADKVLKPFELFRNLELLTVRVSPDFSQRFKSPADHDEVKALEQSVKSIAEGSSPCERVFMMNENLLAYAQSFEIHEAFKSEMRMDAGLAEKTRHDRDCNEQLYEFSDDNPFKKGSFHPVEENLEMASQFSDINAVTEFRKKRRAVIDYLEPQYQRLMTAKKNVEKDGAWTLDRSLTYLSLSNYAQAFHRDMPEEIQAYVVGMQNRFDARYKFMTWQVCLDHMFMILQVSRWPLVNHEELSTLAKTAKEAMDDHFSKIRTARAALFENDLEETTDVELKAFKEDKIIWRYGDNSHRSDGSNHGRGGQGHTDTSGGHERANSGVAAARGQGSARGRGRGHGRGRRSRGS